MKLKLVKAVSIAGLLSLSQLTYASEITDTYNAGDTLTAVKMDNIKSAINDNSTALIDGNGLLIGKLLSYDTNRSAYHLITSNGYIVENLDPRTGSLYSLSTPITYTDNNCTTKVTRFHVNGSVFYTTAGTYYIDKNATPSTVDLFTKDTGGTCQPSVLYAGPTFPILPNVQAITGYYGGNYLLPITLQ